MCCESFDISFGQFTRRMPVYEALAAAKDGRANDSHINILRELDHLYGDVIREVTTETKVNGRWIRSKKILLTKNALEALTGK